MFGLSCSYCKESRDWRRAVERQTQQPHKNTTGCTKDKYRDRREEGQWTMKEAVLWQTQTFDLRNGTICFCLAPVDHVSVLRLRRENCTSSVQKQSPSYWKTDPPPQKSSGRSGLYGARRCVFESICLSLATLTWISTFIGKEEPC